MFLMQVIIFSNTHLFLATPVFTILSTFPKDFFPSGNFSSSNFPNVQFLKRQLPKSVLAAALSLF